ncbi:MAG TPA: tetratricopeptide repeat protein [Allosphingosinicella sp.]|jgi:tetratricopeptide (TPR) repeat protein|nr:tetratricopeptide repeat protein [Allosphingosinicella sp.]
MPWTESDFAAFVHAGGATLETATKNLRNWKNKGRLPDNKKDADRIERIFFELFDNDPNLQHWREDLENALESGRRRQSARIAKSEPPEVSRVPRPTAHFIGRDDDVETLAQALVSSDTPPAILIQAGPGIGKTELTKAIAHHTNVAARFGERRWFVPLETAASANAMQDAIIRAVGGDPRQGFAAALQSLGGRETLLILDNLETPWEPPEQRLATEQSLAELAAVPGVAILASFRGREMVGGLRWVEHFLEALSGSEAATLFASIAGQWVRDDPELQNFIDALSGIPLAIELVARRAHGRANLAALWREWIRLGTDFATRPGFESERLTSLSHSIELSLRSQRMTESAVRLFRLLGVLPAGLASQDIDALLADSSFEAAERLCHVGIAIERSGRLDLLPPVRDHALRHYEPKGGDVSQWVQHFLAMTKHLGEAIGTSNDEGALRRLLPEFSNIEAAFRARLARGQRVDAMGALEGLNKIASLATVTTNVFEELAAACRVENDMLNEARCVRGTGHIAFRRADYAAARPAFEQALQISAQVGDASGEADCLRLLGETALYCVDYEAAQLAYEKALWLYQLVEDTLGQANCTRGLGDIAFRRSDNETARLAYDNALSLYKSSGNRLGETHCIWRLGEVALSRSEYDAASVAYEKALPLYRWIGDTLGEANCIKCLGEIALARTDYDAARRAYEEALPIYRRIGAVLGEANCIDGLGNVALARFDHDAARQAYEEALLLYRRTGSVLGEANAISSLGDIALAQFDYDAAHLAYEEALPLYRKYGNVLGEANCFAGSGNIAFRRSDYDAAQAAHERALSLYRQIGELEDIASCIWRLGNIALARADYDAAQRAYEEALPIYKKFGIVLGEANCIACLGDTALALSDYKTAQAAYERALPLFRELGSKAGEAECVSGLGDIALARSDRQAARLAFEEALLLYRHLGDLEREQKCADKLKEL